MDSITYIWHGNIIRIHVCDLEILAFWLYCIAVLEKYTGHHWTPYHVIRETALTFIAFMTTRVATDGVIHYSLEHSLVLILLCFVDMLWHDL